MTLIKSISGIRGTIGGHPGDALTPVDIVKFTYAYCVKLRERRPKAEGERYKVVVGKDARISGEMVENLVVGTLLACGVDVVKASLQRRPRKWQSYSKKPTEASYSPPRIILNSGMR